MMRIIAIIMLSLLTAGSALAQSYHVDWSVVASGGGHSESMIYGVDGTVSQTAIGRSSSESYSVVAGFWAGVGGPVCRYIPGDANSVPPFNGIDVTYSVNYFKGIGPAPPDTCDCPHIGVLLAAADANGDCVYNGIDVTYSINYLKGLGGPPLACQECAPRGMRLAVERRYPGGSAMPIKSDIGRALDE